MARDLPDWKGKNDNVMPPPRVKERIRERQGNLCALTGVPLAPGTKVEYDHITPLWLGGINAESNIQAVTHAAHKAKTKAEATVRAKCNRTRKKHMGIKTEGTGFRKDIKRKMNGDIVNVRTGEIIKRDR